MVSLHATCYSPTGKATTSSTATTPVSAPKKRVVLMGNRAFDDLLASIQALIGTLKITVTGLKKRVSMYAARVSGGNKQAKADHAKYQHTLDDTEATIAELRKFWAMLKKDWSAVDSRVIGHVVWSPPITSLNLPHGYTCNVTAESPPRENGPESLSYEVHCRLDRVDVAKEAVAACAGLEAIETADGGERRVAALDNESGGVALDVLAVGLPDLSGGENDFEQIEAILGIVERGGAVVAREAVTSAKLHPLRDDLTFSLRASATLDFSAGTEHVTQSASGRASNPLTLSTRMWPGSHLEVAPKGFKAVAGFPTAKGPVESKSEEKEEARLKRVRCGCTSSAIVIRRTASGGDMPPPRLNLDSDHRIVCYTIVTSMHDSSGKPITSYRRG
ncbi:hypothetical protein EVG20_g6775 [Dentipellis fragilis]|uniref:Uncharacterized protein n=1 Tax=Dentipellis fragilis TaxID=205917 RepID=A0A4Y9YKV0_9AGAM|nr:hypothetical protein EVG20_g6775 [Dentipellis fragilis]